MLVNTVGYGYVYAATSDKLHMWWSGYSKLLIHDKDFKFYPQLQKQILCNHFLSPTGSNNGITGFGAGLVTVWLFEGSRLGWRCDM